MSRWFRYYDDAVNDPKVQRLAPHLFKAWINLLCLANKTGNGALPSVADIAFALRMSDIDAQSVVDELLLCGLIDIAHDKSLSPHNWKARQAPSDSSKERTKKWRHGQKKTTAETVATVTVTAGDGNRDAPDQTRPDIESDIEPDQTSDQEVGFELLDFSGGVVVGSVQSIDIETKRDVCKSLGIVDAEPIVSLFTAWQRKQAPSKRARDPNAMFKSSAQKFFAGMSDDERLAIAITVGDLAPPRPPAKPSPALTASNLVRSTARVR